MGPSTDLHCFSSKSASSQARTETWFTNSCLTQKMGTLFITKQIRFCNITVNTLLSICCGSMTLYYRKHVWKWTLILQFLLLRLMSHSSFKCTAFLHDPHVNWRLQVCQNDDFICSDCTQLKCPHTVKWIERPSVITFTDYWCFLSVPMSQDSQ